MAEELNFNYWQKKKVKCVEPEKSSNVRDAMQVGFGTSMQTNVTFHVMLRALVFATSKQLNLIRLINSPKLDIFSYKSIKVIIGLL